MMNDAQVVQQQQPMAQPNEQLSQHSDTARENSLKRSREEPETKRETDDKRDPPADAPSEKKIKLDSSAADPAPAQQLVAPQGGASPPANGGETKSEGMETKAKLMAKLKGVVKKTDHILESATGTAAGAAPEASQPKKSSRPKQSKNTANNNEAAAERATESETKERRSRRSRKLNNMDDSYELADTATRALVGPFRTCYEILQQMKKHRWAWPFAQPVDIEGLGIHDYLTIIKRPMDLGTVQRKLTAGQYSTVYEFSEDMNLIWSNCMIYNQSGSDVVRMAQALQRLFEEKFKRVVDEIESPAGSPSSRVKEMQSRMREMQSKIENMSTPNRQHEDQKMATPPSTGGSSARGRGSRKSASGGSTRGKKSATSASDKRPMSFEEKKELSEHIGQLNNEQLARVVEIIQFHASHDDYSKQTDTEIEIDLDQLEPVTLRALDRFAKECLGIPIPTKKKSKSSSKKATPAKRANSASGQSSAEANAGNDADQPHHDTDEETDDDSDSSTASSGDELDSDSDDDKKNGPQSLSATQASV